MDGLLGGKFHFIQLPDGLVDKTKAICTVCKAEFKAFTTDLAQWKDSFVPRFKDLKCLPSNVYSLCFE